jgi:hypothetical protein
MACGICTTWGAHGVRRRTTSRLRWASSSSMSSPLTFRWVRAPQSPGFFFGGGDLLCWRRGVVWCADVLPTVLHAQYQRHVHDYRKQRRNQPWCGSRFGRGIQCVWGLVVVVDCLAVGRWCEVFCLQSWRWYVLPFSRVLTLPPLLMVCCGGCFCLAVFNCGNDTTIRAVCTPVRSVLRC